MRMILLVSLLSVSGCADLAANLCEGARHCYMRPAHASDGPIQQQAVKETGANPSIEPR